MEFHSILSLVLILVIKLTAGKPTEPQSQDTPCEALAADTAFYKQLTGVLSAMDNMVGNDLRKIFNTLNELKNVNDRLEDVTKDDKTRTNTPVVNGKADEMETRCPVGFKAVPGDNTCYYLSNYRVPWNMANEYCYQLRAEPVSIETTRKHFIITHIIQSDPETRKVEKWWTSGRSNGFSWIWDKGLQRMLFNGGFEYWADDSDKQFSFEEHCVVLDAEHNYKWKSNRCDKNFERNSVSPTHHFICQKAALPKQRTQRASQTNSRIFSSIIPQTVDIIQQPEIKGSHLIMLNDQAEQEETTTGSQPVTTS